MKTGYPLGMVNLKGAWFLSLSRKFFFVCCAIAFKAFQRGPTKYSLQKKILFHIDLIKMIIFISLTKIKDIDEMLMNYVFSVPVRQCLLSDVA
jgi:hypothetical protein